MGGGGRRTHTQAAEQHGDTEHGITHRRLRALHVCECVRSEENSKRSSSSSSGSPAPWTATRRNTPAQLACVRACVKPPCGAPDRSCPPRIFLRSGLAVALCHSGSPYPKKHSRRTHSAPEIRTPGDTRREEPKTCYCCCRRSSVIPPSVLLSLYPFSLFLSLPFSLLASLPLPFEETDTEERAHARPSKQKHLFKCILFSPCRETLRKNTPPRPAPVPSRV